MAKRDFNRITQSAVLDRVIVARTEQQRKWDWWVNRIYLVMTIILVVFGVFVLIFAAHIPVALGLAFWGVFVSYWAVTILNYKLDTERQITKELAARAEGAFWKEQYHRLINAMQGIYK